jgi:hypothetical protein
MTEIFRKHRAALAIAAFALLAVFMRFNRLTAWPLSLDESYSAFGAGKSFFFIWNVLPGYETHPPFYSALLRCWMLLAGNSTMSLRTLGALVGLMTLPAIWLAAREVALFVRRDRILVPLLGLALASVLPPLVELARFVRPYYMTILVYTLGVWALVRLGRLHRQSGTLSTAPWAIYLASLPLMIWLHNLGALFVAAMVLALLILIGPITLLKHHWRAFVIGHGLALLGALPALLILLDQAPTWTHSTWLAFVPSSLPTHLQLIYGWPGRVAAAGGMVLAGFGLRAMGLEARRLGAALLILGTLPVLLSMAISATVAPVFLVRTLVSCSVPILLVVALGANEGLWQRTGMVLLFVFTTIRVIQVQYMGPDQDWYRAARWLSAHVGANDLVYAYPNEGALPMQNALRDVHRSVPIRQIPSDIPARDPAGWYPTGSRGVQSLTPERLAQIAGDPISQRTPTIWLFRLGKRPYDLNDEFEKALGKDRRRVEHFQVKEIDIIGFARSAEPASPKQTKP